MIEAVIFDMDGVLIESEPLWREAEIKVFERVGISLTEDMCRQTTGFRTDETVAHWYRFQPWDNPSQEEIGLEIEKTVCDIIDEKGVPAPGVREIIKFFKERNIPRALASSSAPDVIEHVLKKLDLANEFVITSSGTNEEFGKPHPAVYITTARKLGITPSGCLAIEDSLAGLLAAKAAKMKTVVVPEKSNLENPKFSIADLILNSLEDFSDDHWDLLQSMNGMQ